MSDEHSSLGLTHDDVEAIVEHLRLIHERDGVLPNSLVKDHARRIGVSHATLRRYLRTGVPPMRRTSSRRYRLTDAGKQAFFDAWGSSSEAWRLLVEAGEPGLPTLRAFQRAVQRDLTVAERADAVGGRQRSRNYQVYVQRRERKPNGVWEMDLFELPVLARTTRGQEVHLWLAVALDCCTRAVMGWAVGNRNHGLVLAALGDAIRRPAGGLGGIPEVLRPDNGLEFTADAVREAAQDLGSAIAPTRVYSPHLKGKIERLGRTIKQEALLGLPFHRREPRSTTGRPYTDRDRFEAPLDTLIIAKLDAFFDHYNWHRQHSALDGRIPGELWVEKAYDVSQPTPAQIRRYLLRGIRRRVTKKGVRHHNLHFVAPALNRLVGTDVEARTYPHDDRQIEIYLDGQWLCTAYPSDSATEEQREALFEQRRRDHDQARRLRTETNRRKRARLLPRSSAESATDTTTPSQTDAARELSAPRRARRRSGLPDALGIAHRLNRPHNPQED